MLGCQHTRRIEAADGDRRVLRYAARELQRHVPPAAHPQERRKIVHAAAFGQQFVVQPGAQLGHAHAVAPGNLFQHLPEKVLQPDAGGHAVQPHRAGATGVERRVGADKDLAHGVSPPKQKGEDGSCAGARRILQQQVVGHLVRRHATGLGQRFNRRLGGPTRTRPPDRADRGGAE